MKLTNRKECTDWFAQSGYGVFFHYLYDTKETEKFNAKRFAADVAQTGAKYAFITLGQNSGYFCAPNQTYETLTNNAPGSKCYKGDVPMQAADALDEYGIKLMLYISSFPPGNDPQATEALGLPGCSLASSDWVMNDVAVENWAKVIESWSVHYGKRIHGWWFDGFYDFIGMKESYGKIYKEAVLAGNSDSILALNQGVEPVIYPANKYCDYTAGELNDFGPLPETRFVDDSQWHVLSFLGNNWCEATTKYDACWLTDYISKANSKNGVVTIEMHIEPDGSLAPQQLDVMKQVKKNIRG